MLYEENFELSPMMTEGTTDSLTVMSSGLCLFTVMPSSLS